MLTLLLITAVAILVLRYLLIFVSWKYRANSLTANVASWMSVPLFGHAYKFLGNTEDIFKLLVEVSELMDRHGGRFKIWMGPTLLLFTTRPDDLRIVNNTFLDKPFIYTFANLWIKNGIANAPGHIWKKTIKRVHNAFTASVTDGFEDVHNYYARKLTRLLKADAGKPPFDANKTCITYVVLEAICHTVMGVENVDNSVVSEEYYSAFNRAAVLLMDRARNPVVFPNFVYEMTSKYREFKKCCEEIHKVSRLVIETKSKEIEERKKTGNIDNYTVYGEKSKFRSVLDNFLESKATDPTLTDQQIQADVDNFLAAGYETTAVTTLMTLILLGSHPQVQEKLHDEIKEIFGDSNRNVTKSDLERLKYCEAVVCESIRMYPVVPIVMRHAERDLKLDGCTVPQDAVVVDFLWGACHSRTYWGQDANQFVPERWFKESQPDPAAFASFSYGRRICIAKKSAIVFIKIIITHVIRELIIKSEYDKLRMEMNITLCPIKGPGRYLQVEKRF